jgi:hypothetical protein
MGSSGGPIVAHMGPHKCSQFRVLKSSCQRGCTKPYSHVSVLLQCHTRCCPALTYMFVSSKVYMLQCSMRLVAASLRQGCEVGAGHVSANQDAGSVS